MTEGFVDSASLYEVTLALARSKPKLSYKMEWDRSLVVTTAFINARQIRLAPSPKAEAEASGAYGIILAGLRDPVSHILLADGDLAKALSKTKTWARDNVHNLRQTLAKFLKPSSSPDLSPYQLWLDAHIANEWSEHARRHRGLFDAEFIPQLCNVLGLSRAELEKVRERTDNPSFVQSLVRRRPDNDEFRLVRDAFIVSTLLRGVYHEYAAKEAEGQIVTHPIRRPIQTQSAAGRRRTIDVSNTERYLSNIVMASAFSERNHEQRAGRWANDVATLRRVRKQINLDPKDSDKIALDVAVRAAKQFHIAPSYRLIETVVDVGIALGSDALISFVLSPWAGFIASGIMYAASVNQKVGISVIRPLSERRGRLQKLAQFEPGRIDDGGSPKC